MCTMKKIIYVPILLIAASLLMFSGCEKAEMKGDFGKIAGALTNVEGDLEGIPVKLYEKNDKELKADKKTGKALKAGLADNMLVAETRTDKNGDFQFERLTPKEYILKAFPEKMDPIKVNVSVTAYKTVELDLNVKKILKESKATVNGVVLDKKDQSPLADIKVKLHFLDNDSLLETKTNKKGKFSFLGVDKGIYRLVTEDDTYQKFESKFSVRDEEPVEFAIELPLKKNTLRGQIVDATANNNPITDQKIELLQDQTKIRECKSDGSGLFKFEKLPYGDYTLICEKENYNTYKEHLSIESPEIYRKVSLIEKEAAVAVQDVQVNNATENSADFSVGVSTLGINSNSSARKNLKLNSSITQGNFSISDTTANGYDFKFSGVLNFTSTAQNNNYNYSSMLLIDQSGSISGTDPNHVRLKGAKLFLGNTTSKDEVGLAAFASGGMLKTDPYTIYEGGLSNNPGVFYDEIDTLENKVTGGTPLYQSTKAMTDIVAREGNKRVKSVVVFTDGMDNGPSSLEEAVNNAQNQDVKLVTIGLGEGTNRQVLSEMAQETDGYSIWSGNTKQLASAFVDLEELLRENKTTYTLDFELNVSGAGDFFPGTVSFNMQFCYNGKEKQVPITLTVTEDQLQDKSNVKLKSSEKSNNTRLYEKVTYPDW